MSNERTHNNSNNNNRALLFSLLFSKCFVRMDFITFYNANVQCNRLQYTVEWCSAVLDTRHSSTQYRNIDAWIVVVLFMCRIYSTWILNCLLSVHTTHITTPEWYISDILKSHINFVKIYKIQWHSILGKNSKNKSEHTQFWLFFLENWMNLLF